MTQEQKEALTRRDFARLTATGLGAFAVSDLLVRVFSIGNTTAYGRCPPCDPCDTLCPDCDACDTVCDMCDGYCDGPCEPEDNCSICDNCAPCDNQCDVGCEACIEGE